MVTVQRTITEFIQDLYNKAHGAHVDIKTLLTSVSNLELGIDNFATLDENGKVPLSQINDAILGQLLFGGIFDVHTGTVHLTDNAKTKIGWPGDEINLKSGAPKTTPEELQGLFFIASNDGLCFDIDFEVGDWLISVGDEWHKIDNTDAVASVNGKIGNVVLNDTDIDVTTAAPVAANTQSAAGTRTLRAQMKILIDNIAHLFANKQNTLNRTVGSNDNATGTVTDTGANLSIPLTTTLAPALATNAQNTSTAAQAIRAVLQSFRNNIAHLFANKSDVGHKHDATDIETRLGLAQLPTSATANRFLRVGTANSDPVYAAIVAADVPNLATSKITSGTFQDARIASAEAWNAKQEAEVRIDYPFTPPAGW